MLDALNKLMQHAVEMYGRDRCYKIRFGASTPIVLVTWPDNSEIAELFLRNDEIVEKKFFA